MFFLIGSLISQTDQMIDIGPPFGCISRVDSLMADGFVDGLIKSDIIVVVNYLQQLFSLIFGDSLCLLTIAIVNIHRE